MILHVMEIFVLTKYNAYVTLDSTKVHKKQRLQSVSANSISPPETPEPAQAHALQASTLVRVFLNMKYPMRGDDGIFQSILSENFIKDVGEYMKLKVFLICCRNRNILQRLFHFDFGRTDCKP